MADQPSTERAGVGLAPWTPPPEGASWQNRGPLAQFGGRKPPAPAWFEAAIAVEPERTIVPVRGANIELLTWGKRGAPGLILVHGKTAHADWWTFFAPFLAEHYRVAALSLSGMGGSDWRAHYSFETHAAEVYACAEAAGLYQAPEPPIYIGHSVGGSVVYHTAKLHPERMTAAILVDAGLNTRPPAETATGEAAVRIPQVSPHRLYSSVEAALERFRFLPPQACANFYIVDFIARRSLKPVTGEAGEAGWTWRYDPLLFAPIDGENLDNLRELAGAPMVHLYGSHSNVIRRVRDGALSKVLNDVPHFVIPDSDHHVMIDQPLALVAALRGVLATWKPG